MALVRDVATVGSATLVSRLLGFVRDMAIAALLGAGAFSDAFFAVLQVSNFFRRLLGEGAKEVQSRRLYHVRRVAEETATPAYRRGQG